MLSFQSAQFQTAFMINFYMHSLPHLRHLPCCIVTPACTVLLFYPTHFYWCVLP